MLRRNLATHFGLVNGAIRTVTDIVVHPGNNMPTFVMVNFDRYNGPTHNGSVPIVPVESRWTYGTTECSRIQIPLDVAFATTIHKSQGLT